MNALGMQVGAGSRSPRYADALDGGRAVRLFMSSEMLIIRVLVSLGHCAALEQTLLSQMRDARSPARALLTGALRARPRRATTRRPLRAGLPATLLLCSSLCLCLRLNLLLRCLRPAIAGLSPRAARSRMLRSKCYVCVACALRSLARSSKAFICCALRCMQPIIDGVQRSSARGVSRCVRLSGGSLSDEEPHPIADMDEQRLVPALSTAQFRCSSLRALSLSARCPLAASLARSLAHSSVTCNSPPLIINQHESHGLPVPPFLIV